MSNTRMTNNNHKCISVLMPIYNSSKYLQRSLDSVTKQTLKNIEVICINDGSTDDSLDIIHKYSKEDSRITIIDKPNSGYGDSMNRGLKIARGEYIAILEPDDWYELNMLDTLYKLAIKNNLDIAKSDFYQYNSRVRQDKQYHLFKPSQCNRILSNNSDSFIYFLQPSIWSAIYKRSFLNKNDIGFLNTPGASYQDTSFNFKVFAIAKRIMFIDKPLLHYCIDNNQSSINNIAKKLPYIDKEYDEIDGFIKNTCNIPKDVQKIANSCRFLTYLWAMEQLSNKSLHDYILHIHTILSKNDINNYNRLSDRQQRDLSNLVKKPHRYYIQKLLRLRAHRLKLSVTRQYRSK